MGIVNSKHHLGRVRILQKGIDRPAHQPGLGQTGRLHRREDVRQTAKGQAGRGDRRRGGQHLELAPIETLKRLAEQAGLAYPGNAANNQAAAAFTRHKFSEPG
ncbi:hypothetical protein Rhe02_71750 [Rhizocola hellebori]|uniref:Uncharacterized protein n=1 Tax=Rhizocola hellebori TaxID=1392758 RepID=A0A8J3QDX1_9ACTN|nr:hypothetical protein Rhe02_71750 [Rhizocola hellebori]